MIQNQMLNLFTMIPRAQEPEPVHLICEMWSLALLGILPMPWTSWLLIVLIRHREQQLALKRMLHDELPEIFNSKSEEPLHHKGWKIQPAWNFEYFILTEEKSGRKFLVNQIGSDDYICKDYELGEVVPWSPEHRFACLCDEHPHAYRQAYADLEATEILEKVGIDREPEPFLESDFVVLSPYILQRTGAIQAFISRWDQPASRLWLSCLLGDWFAALRIGDHATRAHFRRTVRPLCCVVTQNLGMPGTRGELVAQTTTSSWHSGTVNVEIKVRKGDGCRKSTPCRSFGRGSRRCHRRAPQNSAGGASP